MTKKSLSRQQRDLEAGRNNDLKKAFEKDMAGNTHWDELKQTYSANCKLIATAAQVGTILKDSEILAYVENKKALTEQVTIFTRDLNQLLGELKMIHAKHETRFGEASVEEVMTTLNLFEAYALWASQYQALIEPTMYQIIEITNAAEVKLNEARLAAAEATKAEEVIAETTEEVKND